MGIFVFFSSKLDVGQIEKFVGGYFKKKESTATPTKRTPLKSSATSTPTPSKVKAK